MSRHQVTTIAVLVTMRLPPGTHAADGINYVNAALKYYKEHRPFIASLPINNIDLAGISTKLVRKETTYL